MNTDKGGAILYLKNHFIAKQRVDLKQNLLKSKELEPVFVEVYNNNKNKNIFYGPLTFQQWISFASFV